MSTHMLNHLPTLAERPDSHSLDLMFILDIVCGGPTFQSRCNFIRNVIRLVEKEPFAKEHLRVGLIPYGPHVHDRVPAARLSGRSDSTVRFMRNQTAHPSGTFEAAYEESLYALYNVDWGPTTHRVLVTVGHRPPYPYNPWSQSAGDPLDCPNQQFCDKNLDWRLLLPPLRSLLRLHSIVVACPSTWNGDSALTYTDEYANYCWREIGYTSLLNFDSTTAGDVVRIIRELV